MNLTSLSGMKTNILRRCSEEGLIAVDLFESALYLGEKKGLRILINFHFPTTRWLTFASLCEKCDAPAEKSKSEDQFIMFREMHFKWKKISKRG